MRRTENEEIIFYTKKLNFVLNFVIFSKKPKISEWKFSSQIIFIFLIVKNQKTQILKFSRFANFIYVNRKNNYHMVVELETVTAYKNL